MRNSASWRSAGVVSPQLSNAVGRRGEGGVDVRRGGDRRDARRPSRSPGRSTSKRVVAAGVDVLAVDEVAQCSRVAHDRAPYVAAAAGGPRRTADSARVRALQFGCGFACRRPHARLTESSHDDATDAAPGRCTSTTSRRRSSSSSRRTGGAPTPRSARPSASARRPCASACRSSPSPASCRSSRSPTRCSSASTRQAMIGIRVDRRHPRRRRSARRDPRRRLRRAHRRQLRHARRGRLRERRRPHRRC